MAELSDLEPIMEFVRSNRFGDTKSVDSVRIQQDDLFDYESFVFPITPRPPPVRAPAAHHQSVVAGDEIRGFEEILDSDDEFVSVDSSATDPRESSEFTNPYGFRDTTHTPSDTSSDRLSQFGTARGYLDFDLQNDLYLCSDGALDFLSEDKFVMTSDPVENFQPFSRVTNFLDKPCLEDSVSTILRGFNNHSIDKILLENGVDEELESCRSYDCPKVVRENLVDSDSSLEQLTNKCSNKCSEFSQNDLVVEFNSALNLNRNFSTMDIPKNIGKSPQLLANEVGDDNVGFVDGDYELAKYNPLADEHEVFYLKIVHRKNRTGFEENKDFPIVLRSMIAGRYRVTEYIGSAAFSKVIRAHDVLTGADVCLKIIKNDKDFFDQSLDEIKLLKFVNKYDPLDERHILRLYDYFYYQEHLFIVCELLGANLYEFQKLNQESGGDIYFTLRRLQIITRQCLEALEFLHHLQIIHCDLKPENILIKNYKRCEIKVIDLGSSCFKTDNLCLYVQSRSYRAPEVIIGLPYDEKIDIWSLGCILAELCSGEVLFPNDEIVLLLGRVIGMLGPIDLAMLVKGRETNKYFTKEYDLYRINEETKEVEYIIPESWPSSSSSLEQRLGVSDIGFVKFIRDLLQINPNHRPTATEALHHPWLLHPYNF